MAGGLGGWATDTASLYARVFRRGTLLAIRNWPVGLALLAYEVLLSGARGLLMPLGFVGGVLLYLATVAWFSAWLHLVEQAIRVGRVRLEDVWSGAGAYLGDLLAVGFVLWLLSMVDGLVLAANPLLRIVLWLAVLVFLNAVPELVYLGRRSVGDVIVESYRFVGENWIEWFPPTVALSALVLLIGGAGPRLVALAVEAWPGFLGYYAASLAFYLVLGLALYLLMIVRGLLFLELTTSSRRGRAFQRRAAS